MYGSSSPTLGSATGSLGLYPAGMRTAFHERMDALTAQLAEMCGLAGVAMEHATQALLQADLPLAEQVITDHDRLITMRAQAEENALLLLALHAPVAGDLRAVVSSPQNVADAKRMGGLRLMSRRSPAAVTPRTPFQRKLTATSPRWGASPSSWATAHRKSCCRGTRAEIDDEDDAMDELHGHLFIVLMDREWKHSVAAAVDVTLLGRFYERFADHAVEIGRRVIFQAIGRTSGVDVS